MKNDYVDNDLHLYSLKCWPLFENYVCDVPECKKSDSTGTHNLCSNSKSSSKYHLDKKYSNWNNCLCFVITFFTGNIFFFILIWALH